MNWYEKYILPRLIETACSGPPMQRLRQRYVPRATGAVLEIGIGSGHNLPFYGEGVSRITGIDPHARLNEMARERAAEIDAPVDVLGLSGEDLAAEDNAYDSVVCTWTLCSIPDAERAVSEMHRVLKPGGHLYFVEHGLSPDPAVQRWQRRIEPLWKIIGGGCHLTRSAPELLEDGGFNLAESDAGYQPGPKFAAWMYHGVAVAQ